MNSDSMLPVGIAREMADAEIVWNKRFFRPGVWKQELIGGQDFVWWSDVVRGNPRDDIEGAASLLEGGDPLVLMVGLDVVDALRRHLNKTLQYLEAGTSVTEAAARLLGVDRIVTLGTVLNAGWSDRFENAVHPKHALLIRTTLKDGIRGIIASELGSSHEMRHPGQGVIFLGCAR